MGANVLNSLKPVLAMVVVQLAFVGVNIFYKFAATAGLSLRVIIAYRYMFSAAFMVPIAFFVERSIRPKLTLTILFQGFLCGLFGGALGQNLFLQSLALTSPTFTSAMVNLVPAITFVLAVLLRMEKLAITTAAGIAKVLGTAMGISGAMVLTFYKGKPIDFLSTDIDLLAANHVAPKTNSSSGDHILGFVLAIASCFSFALWFIVQAKINENFPCPYSIAALTGTFASIQAIIFTVCVEKDWTKWQLGFDIRLWTVLYTGVVAAGLVVALMAWCVRMRGPLFVSVFNPLMLVLVALFSSLFLKERLYIGSILGAVLIISGLYVVLWGKGKEAEMNQTASTEIKEDEEKKIGVTSDE